MELDELNFEKILQKSNKSGNPGVVVKSVTSTWNQVCSLMISKFSPGGSFQLHVSSIVYLITQHNVHCCFNQTHSSCMIGVNISCDAALTGQLVQEYMKSLIYPPNSIRDLPHRIALCKICTTCEINYELQWKEHKTIKSLQTIFQLKQFLSFP